jgi:hypothetical protein
MNPELARLVIAFLEDDAGSKEKLSAWLTEHGHAQVSSRHDCFHAVLGVILRQSAHELACDFAEHVLPIYEQFFLEDDRPRRAIAVRRRWIRAQTGDEDWYAAWRAAGEAARATSQMKTQPGGFNRDATAFAAWASCGGCARACGDDAASRAAAYARFAAGYAACGAAGLTPASTEWEATIHPATVAELDWQIGRLREMLLL